jgi:type I restriction enzyme R subunit
MAIYDLISENDESTVVAEFEQGIFASEAPYMSERNLEDQFVNQLGMQEYEYMPISPENELIVNLRKQHKSRDSDPFSEDCNGSKNPLIHHSENRRRCNFKR